MKRKLSAKFVSKSISKDNIS